MNLKAIWIFALLLIFSTAKAQISNNDYIITAKGDTVAAKIKLDLWTGKITYQLMNKKASRVDDGYVKEYHWLAKKNPIFVAVMLPGKDKPVFANMLARGKINLYEFLSRNGKNSSKHWYAKKGNLPLVEVQSQNRLFGADKQLVQNLTNLLNDKSQVIEKLNQEKRYNFKAVSNLIEQYNSI